MPITRSQKMKNRISSRRDDEPDLFEPSTYLLRNSRRRSSRSNHAKQLPAIRHTKKRPAIATTSTVQEQPLTNVKKKPRRLTRRNDVRKTPPDAVWTQKKLHDRDTTTTSASADENSTTATSTTTTPVKATATVTPASARVRQPASSLASIDPRPSLPEQVVDIFHRYSGGGDSSRNDDRSTLSLGLPGELSSEETMRNYVTGFMHSYGLEYYHQIYIQEKDEYQETYSWWATAVAGDDDTTPPVPQHQFQMKEPPLDLTTILPFQPLLTIKMRHILVSWLAEVTTEFKLSQSAYHLAISMLDELLRMGPTIEKYKQSQETVFQAGVISDDDDDDDEKVDQFLIKPRQFQAVGCACIWIASKIEDRTPPSSEQLNFISDNACTTELLLQLESRIMELFKFRPLRITPVHFLDLQERASQASTALISRQDIHQHNPQFHHMLLYILQLSRSNYQLCYEKPSIVAASACFLTRAMLGLRSTDGLIWTPTLEFYSGYPLAALSRIVVLLLLTYMEAEKLNSALFAMYKQQERYRVSQKTAPLLTDLNLPGIPVEYTTYERLVEMLEERKTTFLEEVV